MKNSSIFFLLLLVQYLPAFSQTSEFLPQSLGSNINSGFDEINPLISPDGKVLYFSRVNYPLNYYGERDSEDIWFSTKNEDGSWAKAKPLYDLNIGRYNSIAGMSNDGHMLFLNGIYNWTSTFFRKRGLSVSYKLGGTDSWSEPEKLVIRGYSKQNKGLRSGASINDPGNVLILSFSKIYNGNRNHLYVSFIKRNGYVWKRPRKIKALKMKGSSESPFIMANDSVLYFANNSRDKHNYDIYRSIRLDNTWINWSEPELLNDTINTKGWESGFRTNLKGNYAYFASTRDTLDKADIYKVMLWEENPFVDISGRVVRGSNGTALNPGLFTFLANDNKIDSLAIDQNINTFHFKLPLGERYTLQAINPKYVSKPVTIDVSAVKEFTRMNIDIPVEPLPYVLVKGNLLVKGEPGKIPDYANPKIFVNNNVSDSAKIFSGEYSLKLERGKSYNLQVRANKYEPVPHLLDLTGVDEYQEMVVDLYADRKRMAVVSGRIMDQKINNILPLGVKVDIKVEGMKANVVTVDTLLGRYELKLPLGASYTISASAPNYYPIFENIDLRNQTSDVRIYKDLYLVPIEIGESIRLNNIFFETGKSILQPASFAELDRVVEFLIANPDIKIEIAGHTDNVGKVNYNLVLSNSRAKAVADYITTHGVSPDRITSRGYGMSKPVADNKTKEGRALNRRVEFTILEK